MNIRRYSMALRKMGFLKAFDSREGGCRVVQFEHLFGNRKVDVQLWEDGEHRVSHMLNGRGSTAPTPFDGLTEMEQAIRREVSRKDHQPAISGNGYGCTGPCNGKSATCRYPKCIKPIKRSRKPQLGQGKP